MRPGLAGLFTAVALAMAGVSCMGSPEGGGKKPGDEPGPGPGPGPRPPEPPPTVTGPDAMAVQQACKLRDPGPSPIRRLTRWEYDNTIRDLLGDDSRPSLQFPPDERGAGFTNDAQNLSVSPLHIENYMAASERLVAKATADLGKLVPCDPARGDEACALAFIDKWGKRAWRRPLEAEEKAELRKVFMAGLGSDGFAGGIRMVMQVMLQSPQFLYRAEIGSEPPAAGSSMRKLSSWEIASRLSYLFWGSMPDEALFAAADSGKLGTREEVAVQAKRLLADERARHTVAIFHEQWLDLEKMDNLEKDRTLFPAFDPALRPLLRKESETFLEELMWKGDGSLKTLLTAPFTFANEKLAKFYGFPGVTGEAFQRVTYDPKQRAGFLGHASFLASHALPNQTDPVRRGKFIREQLFCQIPPPPPADLMVRPPDLDPKLTTRERFSQHSADSSCAGCHRLMDPLGLGFESFDSVGQWRSMEAGKPVDVSGEIFGTDVDGPFNGAVELAGKLAGSAQVRACVVKQWFRFGYGRSETPQDLCALETLKALYSQSGGNARELLVALTQTDAFLYRRAGETP